MSVGSKCESISEGEAGGAGGKWWSAAGVDTQGVIFNMTRLRLFLWEAGLAS